MGQLQDARNYLFMAVSLIESFSADPNKSESRESIHQVSFLLRVRTLIDGCKQFLERMAFLLKNAKDQLVRYDETRIFNESAANRMVCCSFFECSCTEKWICFRFSTLPSRTTSWSGSTY